MNIEQIRLPEDARHYVVLKLMRVNLANHAVKNPGVQTMGRGLFAAMLIDALKRREFQKKKITGFTYQSRLSEKLKKIFKK